MRCSSASWAASARAASWPRRKRSRYHPPHQNRPHREGDPTMTTTLVALTGFVAWTLFLLVLMEAIRSKLVLTKAIASNQFTPDNANLSPFMQRLARAHANCLEGLPVFGALM